MPGSLLKCQGSELIMLVLVQAISLPASPRISLLGSGVWKAHVSDTQRLEDEEGNEIE